MFSVDVKPYSVQSDQRGLLSVCVLPRKKFVLSYCRTYSFNRISSGRFVDFLYTCEMHILTSFIYIYSIIYIYIGRYMPD